MTTRRTSHAQHAVAGVALALLCQFATPASCAPITPTHDDEVIEVLPAMTGGRAEERRLRKQLALHPRDPALAVGIAKRYLAQAHELGDPRFAGMAMAAIEGWTNEATMPDDVLMMRATLQQYLHAFDGSVHSLQVLLAQAARATGRTEAMQEVRNLLTQMGLRDQRAESVLGHG